MRFWPKIVVAVLAAALVGASWTALSLPEVRAAENHSGCHGHGGSRPAPGPSRDCCLSGHDVAAVQSSHAARPDGDCGQAGVAHEHFTAVSPVSVAAGFESHSSDPPIAVPLRV